jgi:hypothetical protein
VRVAGLRVLACSNLIAHILQLDVPAVGLTNGSVLCAISPPASSVGAAIDVSADHFVPYGLLQLSHLRAEFQVVSLDDHQWDTR